MGVGALNLQQPPINVEEIQKPLSAAKAIQICQEKYPNDFKRKKILTLVIAIGALALSILIKKIDDKTLYWSGRLANIIIEKKEKEAKEAYEKSKKVEVKIKDPA